MPLVVLELPISAHRPDWTISRQRVWGVPNLFLADGSVMPTQGAANPALTIMANALRVGDHLTARLG